MYFTIFTNLIKFLVLKTCTKVQIKNVLIFFYLMITFTQRYWSNIIKIKIL